MTVSKLRYFHEISEAEWKTIIKMKKTWGWVMKHFKQPKWCTYPKALEGMAGCWSLTGRLVTGEDYCKRV